MTDNDINQKVMELKRQVTALEQLLATDEQAVLQQAEKVERALVTLQEAEFQPKSAPTETKLGAEAALQEATELQQAILDNAEYGIISTTVDGLITTFNPAAERMLGYTAAELVGKETAAIMHVPSEVRARAKQFSEELGFEVEPGFEVFVAKARQNLPNQYEWTYVRKDGIRFPVLLAVTALRDAENNITGFLGIAQDITAQKTAEQERARLGTILEATSDFVGIVDPEGQSLYVNKAGREMIGIGLDEDITSLPIAAYHPDRVMPFMAEEVLPAAVQQGVWSGENAFLSRDGREIPVLQVLIAQKTNDGDVEYFATIARDITEQKQAEEKLRERETYNKLLFASSLTPLIVMEAETARYIDCNQAAVEVYGYQSREDVLGKTPLEVSAPIQYDGSDSATAAAQYVKTCLEEGSVLFEWLHQRPTGEYWDAEVHLMLFEPQPGYQLIQFSLRDITEQKQAQTLLAKRATELEAVAQVSTAASTILDTGRLLQEVADLTKERFDLYHAHIYLLDEAGGTLNLVAGAGQVGRQMVAEGWSIPLEREQSLVARAARNGRGVIVNDVQAEPGFMPNPLLPNTHSEMAVPMMIGDRVVGVLDVQADVVDRFTDEDVQIKTTLAAQVAVALENANLLQQTQQALSQTEEQAQHLAQLSQMSAQLNLAATEADIFKVASERTPNIMPADRASIALLTETGDSLEVLALQGKVGAVPVGAFLPVEGTAIGQAVQENLLLNTADTQDSDLADVKLMAQQGIRSTLNAPLLVGGQVIGTLNVGNTQPQAFGLRDENMMRQVAALLSSALENRRLIEEAERASFLLGERVKELNCLNDLGREMEGSPSIPELLQWTTERIPPAMQHPELCVVAIEYDGQSYGMPQAIHLSNQMAHGLYVGSEIVGRVYIAYTEPHDFLNEESALLGGVANRLSGYIENRRLFEQVQLRARREQILREVTDRIRGSVDVETIMRTAAQEVGQVLGRPAFVYLGNGEKSSSAVVEPPEADSQSITAG